MKTTNEKNETTKPTRDDLLKLAEDLLKGDAEAGEKAQRELAEKVAADAMNALQWAHSHAVRIEVGRRCAVVLADAEREDVDLERSIREHLSRTTRELLEREVEASSSSPFSNAVGLARHEAAQRFHRTLTGAVERLDRASSN